MNNRIAFLFLIFLPLIIFAQKNYDPFLTKDKNINSYYRRVDSISNIIYDIKIKVSELNPEFQWDMINFKEFYYNDDKLVYQKYYQSLMDGRFGLDIKFDENQLKVMAFKILSDIKK